MDQARFRIANWNKPSTIWTYVHPMTRSKWWSTKWTRMMTAELSSKSSHAWWHATITRSILEKKSLNNLGDHLYILFYSSLIWFFLFSTYNYYLIDFRKFDLNDSGQISAEELRAVLSKRYRFVSRDEIEELIKKADKNKDGLISIQEFADLLNLWRVNKSSSFLFQFKTFDYLRKSVKKLLKSKYLPKLYLF